MRRQGRWRPRASTSSSTSWRDRRSEAPPPAWRRSSTCSTGFRSSSTRTSRCSCRRCTTRWSRQPFVRGRAPPRSRRRRPSSRRHCARLDERYEATPAGLGVTVAWGLPVLPPLRGGAGCQSSARSTRARPRWRASACARSRTPCASRAIRPRRSSRRTTWPSSSAATRSTRSPTARRRCSRSSTGCSA